MLSVGPTRQSVMHRCGDVNVLQVLQGLGVEEPQGGARAEGDPDAHPGHHHVGHHHPLVLVGLQLPLMVSSRAERNVQSTEVVHCQPVLSLC